MFNAWKYFKNGTTVVMLSDEAIFTAGYNAGFEERSKLDLEKINFAKEVIHNEFCPDEKDHHEFCNKMREEKK